MYAQEHTQHMYDINYYVISTAAIICTQVTLQLTCKKSIAKMNKNQQF